MSIQYKPIDDDITVKYPKMRLPSGLSILFPKIEIVDFTDDEENFDIFINMKEFELFATYTSDSIVIYFKNDGYNFKLCKVPSEIYQQIMSLSQDVRDNLFIRPILKECTLLRKTLACRCLSFDILLKKTKKDLEYQIYQKVENKDINLIDSAEIRTLIEKEIEIEKEKERLEVELANERERLRRESEGLNFVVLDFETANARYDSICAVGIVVVERSQIVKKFYSLVKPSPFVFDPANISINKITPRKCKDAPLFKEIYSEIKELLEGKDVFSHYAVFDNNCLHKRLIADYLEFIDLNHFCSWKTIKESGLFCLDYKQETLAKHYNIEYTPHNAISDAEALAKILLAFCESKNIKHLDDYDFEQLKQKTFYEHTCSSDIVKFNRNTPKKGKEKEINSCSCILLLALAITIIVIFTIFKNQP